MIKLLKMQQLDEDDEKLAYRLVTVKIVCHHRVLLLRNLMAALIPCKHKAGGEI